MLAWHLGWRWLRTRRTAWLALAAITLTVAVPVLVLGVTQGWLDATTRQARATESDLTIAQRALGQGIIDTAERRSALAKIPGVAAVAPYVGTFVLMTPVGANEGVPAQVDGIEWTADDQLGRLAQFQRHPAPALDLSPTNLVPAEARGSGFLTPRWRTNTVLIGAEAMFALAGIPAPIPPRERPLPGVVAGRELLYEKGIPLGTRVTLTASSGARVAAELSDTIGTGILEVDRFALIAPLSSAQALTGNQPRGGMPGRVDGWRLQAAPGEDLVRVAKRIEDATGLRAEPWWLRRGNLVRALELQRNVLALVMIAIQAICIFVIYAVFSTLVAEKRHDIGVLLGLGARRRTITAAFLIAGITCCVLGGVLGWGLGWGVLAAINPLSRWLGVPLFPQDVFYTPEAPTSYDPLIPLLFIGAMTVIGLVAVALPAWRAGRIDPVETLRG